MKYFLLFILVGLIYFIYRAHHSRGQCLFLTRKFLRDISDYDIDEDHNRLLRDIRTGNIRENALVASQPETIDKLPGYLKGITKDINLLLMSHNTHGSDKSFKRTDVIDHPYVRNIFSENWYDVKDPKVTQIPIGISYKDIYQRSLQDDLVSISSSMPHNRDKPLRVLCNAHKNTYAKPASGYRDDRKVMMSLLKDSHIIDFCEDEHDFSEDKLRRTWKKHKGYAFELSPSGNGLDCHRTYEAIILNTIPIVRTNTLDRIYIDHDLPVVIVDEWSEVTPGNLKIWHDKYKSYFTKTTMDKMKSDYWIEYIKSKSN